MMDTTPGFTIAPSLEDIEILARQVLETLPDALRDAVRDVLIRVLDFPDVETERTMKLESPFDLLGLYVGTGLPFRSETAPSHAPDVIELYRRPILDCWCEEGESLPALVRHVLIHEIGHHFGFSDADMARLESETDL